MPSPLDHGEKFKIMARSITSGPFGTKTVWTEGAEFDCLFSFNNSIEALVAEKQGVTSFWNGIVHKATNVKYYEIIKRVSDGEVYRVTSNPNDYEIPSIASFSVKAFTAEKYKLEV